MNDSLFERISAILYSKRSCFCKLTYFTFIKYSSICSKTYNEITVTIQECQVTSVFWEDAMTYYVIRETFRLFYDEKIFFDYYASLGD